MPKIPTAKSSVPKSSGASPNRKVRERLNRDDGTNNPECDAGQRHT